MNAFVATRPCWTTATFAAPIDPNPVEISALRDHVDRCNSLRGRCFGLCCAIDAVHAFVAPRLITTIVVAFAMFGVSSLVLM